MRTDAWISSDENTLNAIVGVTQDGLVVYDIDKMIVCLQAEGMTSAQAVAYIQSVSDTECGPVFIHTIAGMFDPSEDE